MSEQCQHRLELVPMVLRGTVGMRACRWCDYVEVLPESANDEWQGLDEYLSRRLEAQPDVSGDDNPGAR